MRHQPGPHTRFTVAAAEAGKHILLQKPMCLTLDEANAMVAAVRKGYNGGSLEIYGTQGNLMFGGGHLASIISSRKELLPRFDADGWCHFDSAGDFSKAKWPKPVPGGFNYYHVSTQHLIDCILQDRDPVVNVEWGRHITEMMYGAIQSSKTGQRYEMTTKI